MISAPARGWAEEPEAGPAAPADVTVTAIGDSVMLGASAALWATLSGMQAIDAQVSRHGPEYLQIARRLRATGAVPEVVLLQMGNNGPLAAELIDAVLTELDEARVVVVVALFVPRSWQDPNNRALIDAIAYHPNAVTADWHAAASADAALVASDGYHLTAAGSAAYAALLTAAVEGALSR